MHTGNPNPDLKEGTDMAHINKALLVKTATVASRANVVWQDPAVRKTGHTAANDILQAGRSTLAFLSEVHSAWLRSADLSVRLGAASWKNSRSPHAASAW